MKYYKLINQTHWGVFKEGIIYPGNEKVEPNIWPTKDYVFCDDKLRTSWQEVPEHEWVIQEAKLRYPKGTKFMSSYYEIPFTSDGEFRYLSSWNSVISTSNGAVWYNGKWAEIIKEEEKTMGKEIIGYKLKEDAWNSGNVPRNTWLKTIAQLGLIHNEICDKPNEKRVLRSIFENKDVRSNFEKAGVLDLWFEPVYKDDKFPVGTWITYIGGNIDTYTTQVQSYDNGGWVKSGVNKPDGGHYNYTQYRLATPEEIEKVKNPIVKIKGYRAEFFKDEVKFGCQHYSKDFVLQLARFIKNSGLSIEHKDEIMKVAKYYGF